MSAGWLAAILSTSTLAACSFTPGSLSGSTDGATDRPAADPDVAIACDAPALSCADATTLRASCSGQAPADLACPWGCLAAPGPRCAQLVPSGGGVAATDLEPTGLADFALAGVVDGDDGTINGSAASGVDFRVSAGIAVFRFRSLHVTGAVTLLGTRAIALVADGAITLDGVIDARGPCGAGAGRTAGPGGRNGGSSDSSASGTGAGTGTGNQNEGGGGGGHGAIGGDGDGGTNGGAMFGDDQITLLTGGGGGGGGKTSQGGGGGGAVQLVSNIQVTINATFGINAGGCGGPDGDGAGDAGGGGGGAGGTILIEAPQIQIAGTLAVNGGGGANRNDTGSAGTFDRTQAAGAPGGGAGGAGAVLQGATAANDSNHGGGGGAIGRIRLNARTVADVIAQGGAVLSPALGDDPTTTTSAAAAVQ